MFSFISTAFSSEEHTVKFDKNNTDEDEEITTIEKIPLPQCLEMLKNNEFKHASMNVALSLFYFKKLK